MTCNVTLLHGDCLERMKEIPDGSIDMVMTDPPYEISDSGGGMMANENRKFLRQINSLELCKGFDIVSFLDSCTPLFKNKQYWCGVFFCSLKQIHYYLNYAIENNLQYGLGVWYKTNPTPLCHNKYLNDLEYWIYIKGSKSRIMGDYSTKSLAYLSKINITDKKIYGHPTIKPLDLIEKFLINHTIEGNTILDPFMGSGSTGVSCKNLNRNFIGIELDETYFNIAKERIEKETPISNLDDLLFLN